MKQRKVEKTSPVVEQATTNGQEGPLPREPPLTNGAPFPARPDRLVIILLLMGLVNVFTLWKYSKNAKGGTLAIDLPELNVLPESFAEILTVSRVFSVVVTSGMAVHLYFTNNYPLVRNWKNEIVHVRRLKRFTTFTVWSWGILTLYFVWATYLTFSDPSGRSRWFPVLFEVCFCAAAQVTLVVHFILIPVARRKDKYRLSRLLNWRALTLHYANIVMMLIEAVLTQYPIRRQHWIFFLAFGNAYMLFALFWYQIMGVFYYFFMDYNRFWWSPFAYLGLVLIFAAIYFGCAFVHELLEVTL